MTTPGSFPSLWGYGEASAFSPESKMYYNALTSSTLHTVVFSIPRKGGGKIRLLAFGSQLVDAGGY